MIKLFSLKQQSKEGANQQTTQRSTAAFLRVQKGTNDTPQSLFIPSFFTIFHFHVDLAELSLPKTCQLEFPDPNDLLHFKLIIMPDEVLEHTYQLVPVFTHIPHSLSLNPDTHNDTCTHTNTHTVTHTHAHKHTHTHTHACVNQS